jgi:hypothetical protein
MYHWATAAPQGYLWYIFAPYPQHFWSHCSVFTTSGLVHLYSSEASFLNNDFATTAIRVVRFFLLKYTKMGWNVPKDHTITKWPLNVTKGRKVFQMAMLYTNIFHLKAPQNIPKFGYLVWKYNIWQPWPTRRKKTCLANVCAQGIFSLGSKFLRSPH